MQRSSTEPGFPSAHFWLYREKGFGKVAIHPEAIYIYIELSGDTWLSQKSPVSDGHCPWQWVKSNRLANFLAVLDVMSKNFLPGWIPENFPLKWRGRLQHVLFQCVLLGNLCQSCHSLGVSIHLTCRIIMDHVGLQLLAAAHTKGLGAPRKIWQDLCSTYFPLLIEAQPRHATAKSTGDHCCGRKYRDLICRDSLVENECRMKFIIHLSLNRMVCNSSWWPCLTQPFATDSESGGLMVGWSWFI